VIRTGRGTLGEWNRERVDAITSGTKARGAREQELRDQRVAKQGSKAEEKARRPGTVTVSSESGKGILDGCGRQQEDVVEIDG
jgi:hypothetical protein